MNIADVRSQDSSQGARSETARNRDDKRIRLAIGHAPSGGPANIRIHPSSLSAIAKSHQEIKATAAHAVIGAVIRTIIYWKATFLPRINADVARQSIGTPLSIMTPTCMETRHDISSGVDHRQYVSLCGRELGCCLARALNTI
jgi:hypothetical protein